MCGEILQISGGDDGESERLLQSNLELYNIQTKMVMMMTFMLMMLIMVVVLVVWMMLMAIRDDDAELSLRDSLQSNLELCEIQTMMG